MLTSSWTDGAGVQRNSRGTALTDVNLERLGWPIIYIEKFGLNKRERRIGQGTNHAGIGAGRRSNRRLGVYRNRVAEPKIILGIFPVAIEEAGNRLCVCQCHA